MCGIAGILNIKVQTKELRNKALKMAQKIRPPHSRFCHGIDNRTDTAFHQYPPSPGGQASCPGIQRNGLVVRQYSRSYRVFPRISDMGCAIPSRSSSYSRRQHLCQILPFSGSKGSYLPACQRDSPPHPLPRHAYRHPT